MRYGTLLVALLTLCLGGYWSWNNLPAVRNRIEPYIGAKSFQTLEVRFTADEIMESNRKALLQDKEHQFLPPTLKFYPYLLMEVKYNRTSEKTSEGVILWGLVDGEMVINTNSWEHTHGFTDCIAANTTRHEFKIINTLAAHGGSWDRDGLSRFLNVENNVLDTWVDSCRKKSLIVQNGNSFRLHLQNPRLQVVPETKLDQGLVTKSTRHAIRVPGKYRSSQIESIARAAFGDDFAIRTTREVFLPVYSIVVLNPDGTQMTTYWNALNGKRISLPYSQLEDL